MKQLYNFFIGKSQNIPKWFGKLPNFFQPFYIGDYKFKWLGITFHTPNSLPGDTLFMALRRKFNNKKGLKNVR